MGDSVNLLDLRNFGCDFSQLINDMHFPSFSSTSSATFSDLMTFFILSRIFKAGLFIGMTRLKLTFQSCLLQSKEGITQYEEHLYVYIVGCNKTAYKFHSKLYEHKELEL